MEGCKDNVWSKGLCNKHRQREARGTLYKKTWGDKNEVEHHNGVTYLITYKRDGSVSAKSKIDADMVDKILERKWHSRKDGYVASTVNKEKTLFLHHFVIGNSKIVDHINRDRTDNRKDNLRNVTYQQNILNSSLRKDSTTGVKGVRYDKRRLSPWYCTIHINGKTIFGGYFIEKEDAIKRRIELETKYHLPVWNQ